MSALDDVHSDIKKTVHEILAEDNLIERFVLGHVIDHVVMATLKAMVARYGARAGQMIEPFMSTAESLFRPEAFDKIKLFRDVVNTPVDTQAGMRARDEVGNEPIRL